MIPLPILFFLLFLAASVAAAWRALFVARRCEARLARLERPSNARQVEESAPEPTRETAEQVAWASGVSSDPPEPALEEPALEEPVPDCAGEAPELVAGSWLPVRWDWERMVGVRGAAIAGGGVLVLALFLFLQYVVQNYLVSPGQRTATAGLFGLALLAGSLPLWRRGYRITSEALGGAGVVILYGVSWVASVKLGLVPQAMGLAAMALVTLVCGLLSAWRSSLVMALFGLIGGLATPILLGVHDAHTLGLFAWLLVVDALFLVVARGRWPIVGWLALGGTLAIQLLWVELWQRPGEELWGLLHLVSVCALFVGEWLFRPGEIRTQARGRVRLAVAFSVPFALAARMATEGLFETSFTPLALFASILAVGGVWLQGRLPASRLAPLAVLGTLGLASVWCLVNALDETTLWQLVGLFLGLQVLGIVAARFSSPLSRAPLLAATRIAAVGLWLLLLSAVEVGGLVEAGWAPWLVGLGLTGTLWLGSFRGSSRAEHGAHVGGLPAVGAAPAGLAFLTLYLRYQGLRAAPGSALADPAQLELVMVAVLAVALACSSALARWTTAPRVALGAWYGVLAFAALSAGLWCGPLNSLEGLVLPFVVPLGFITWGLLALGPARAPWLFGGFAALAAAVQWVAAARLPESGSPAAGIVWLTAAAFALLPFGLRQRLELGPAKPFALRRLPAPVRVSQPVGVAAALAAFLWWPALEAVLADQARQAGYPGWPSLLLALIPALGLLLLARGRVRVRAIVRAIFALALVICLARALALQIGCAAWAAEWGIEWAVGSLAAALGLAIAWRVWHSAALKWCLPVALATGWACVGLETLRVALGISAGQRSGWLLVHALGGLWAGSCAVSFGVAALLHRRELRRIAAWEREVYAGGWPWIALAAGAAGIAALFGWINVEIVNVFSTGPSYDFSLSRAAERDLAFSIAWGLFALGLLAVGVLRASMGLRRISLGVLLATTTKVFLYDLGELEGLFRVGSVFALAVVLIAVSLAYQRFVFGRVEAG